MDFEALLRAADHYNEQVDPAKGKLDSGKVPLVEWLEAAYEKPSRRRQQR
jgi:hypothetical protein